VAFFVAEAFVPSFGVLGLGGVAAFAFGALLLIDTESPELGIPRAFVAVVTLVSAAVVIGIAAMAARARRRPPVTGSEAMLGAAGVLIARDGRAGWATVRGERWRVRLDRELPVGAAVRVRAVDGLTLEVEPDPGPTRGEER
jgi:membrane-bound serine protease (ClpP class)